MIISPCQQIGIFLVRDMRQDQLYLYPSLCCKDQGIDHFFIDDQIRRHDMYIILWPVEDIKVYLFSHILIVIRAVSVGNDISAISHSAIDDRGVMHVFTVIFLFLHADIPQLQKHQCKAVDRFSLHHDGSIFPVAESFFSIDILICQIHTACESCPPIDDRDFSMIPVILMRR